MTYSLHRLAPRSEDLLRSRVRLMEAPMISTDPQADTHRYTTTEHRMRDGYGGDDYLYIACANDEDALALAREEDAEMSLECLERRSGDTWEPCEANAARSYP